MQEPLDSIDPFDWNVFGDFLSDRDDTVGEARARRIAQVLASGRTRLWLMHGVTSTSEEVISVMHDTFFKDSQPLLSSRLDSGYRWQAYRPDLRGMEGAQPIHPGMFPKNFQRQPAVARAFFDKLAELGPLIWLTEDDTTVSVPVSVAKCPECSGELRAEMTTVGPEGEPGSFLLDCPLDGLRRPKAHYLWQSDWHPVRDAVERWARDHVRVRTREAAKEQR